MKLSILIFFFVFNSFAQVKNVFDIARNGSLKEMQEIKMSNPELLNSINENKSIKVQLT